MIGEDRLLDLQSDLGGMVGTFSGEHDLVTDGLDHPAVVATDDFGGRGLEPLEQIVEFGGVEAAGQRGVPDDVGETHDQNTTRYFFARVSDVAARRRRDVALPDVRLQRFDSGNDLGAEAQNDLPDRFGLVICRVGELVDDVCADQRDLPLSQPRHRLPQ